MLAGAPLTAAAAPVVTFALDPRATIHRTNGDPDAQAPIVISLVDLGLSSGDAITLTALGDLSYFQGGLDIEPAFLFAVFSSTNVVLGPSNLHRLPDALPLDGLSQEEWQGISLPTAVGAIDTDIPEDFVIVPGGYEFGGFVFPGAFAEVPTGASFLIVGGFDAFYSDNADADGDYGLAIASGFLPVTQVPIPLPVLMLGAALGSFAIVR